MHTQSKTKKEHIKNLNYNLHILEKHLRVDL